MSLAACQAKCLSLPGCTAITVSDAGGGNVNCFRKSDVVLQACDSGTSFSTLQRRQWVRAGGFNCYPGHGASNLDSKSCGTLTARGCQAMCAQLPGCSAVVFQPKSDDSGLGSCYRKKDVVPAECDHNTGFDTYLHYQPFAA